MGGVLTPLINRNTTIPTTKSQIFSTAADNQPSVDIMVYQGERPMAADNKLLGHFRLDGIKPARRGQPRIEVTFSIDVNGIVKVNAKDLDTQKEQEITIQDSSGLSKEEIDRMIKEAEENKEADEKRKADVEVKNQAESYINMIDESIEQAGDSIGEDEKSRITLLRDELQTALDEDDLDTLREKMGELEQALDALRQAQAAQGSGEEQPDSSSSDDDTIDADFTEDEN